MRNPFRRHQVMSDDFIAAWTDYMRANAAAADGYEALPITYRVDARAHRCACGVVTANARCRWCRDERKP